MIQLKPCSCCGKDLNNKNVEWLKPVQFWKNKRIEFYNCTDCYSTGLIKTEDKMKRTFRVDKLYHKFLKPKNISIEQLPFLVTKLYEAGFIELYQHESDERFSETEKLTSREHRDELFKIVESLK